MRSRIGARLYVGAVEFPITGSPRIASRLATISPQTSRARATRRAAKPVTAMPFQCRDTLLA